MPGRLSAIVVARIEEALREPGVEFTTQFYTQLATSYDTTVRTIYRHHERIKANCPVGRLSGGPHRVVTWEMEVAIKLLLDQRPWYYQDEIASFLLDVFNVNVTRSTIGMVLKRMNSTRKKLKITAAQRNEELRLDWQYNLQYFTAAQIVCIDESGSDDRTGDRTYGWAQEGTRAAVSRWLASSERVSVLAAYTTEGYLVAQTFLGTCTGPIFEAFIIDHLLPLCNAYPGPKSVLFLDNASVHHAFKITIEAACLRKGVWLRWLPPYSPDFNPIEESFSDMKSFIRRFYRRKRAGFASYQDFLNWVVKEVGTGEAACKRARAHFRNAGIREVAED